MSKHSVFKVCAIKSTKSLNSFCILFLIMGLSLLQHAWLHLGLKSYAIHTKTKYMAIATALEHFCSFSKVENFDLQVCRTIRTSMWRWDCELSIIFGYFQGCRLVCMTRVKRVWRNINKNGLTFTDSVILWTYFGPLNIKWLKTQQYCYIRVVC